MSVLVVIRDTNRVVVGVDTRMSCDDSYVDSYARRPKAIHLNDKKDIIIGGVGNIGLVDVLKEELSQYRDRDLYSIDKSFIVKYIIPALVVQVRNFEMSDRDGKMDGMLLLAIKDKAYLIMGNYNVEEVIKYAAHGSGMEAALGSLYTSVKLLSMSPEDRIKLAIEAAGSFVSSVSKVSYIGDTVGKPFSIADLKTVQKH